MFWLHYWSALMSSHLYIHAMILSDRFANKTDFFLSFLGLNSLDVYTDLVTIYTQSDTDQMQMEEYYAWIGLHKHQSEGDEWHWPKRVESTLNEWAYNKPGLYCAAVLSSNKK